MGYFLIKKKLPNFKKCIFSKFTRKMDENNFILKYL